MRDTKRPSWRREEFPMPVLRKASSKKVKPTLWPLPDLPCVTRIGPGKPWKAGNLKSSDAFTATSAKKLTRPFRKCIVPSGRKGKGPLKFVHTADTHLGFEVLKVAASDSRGRQKRADSILGNFLKVIDHALESDADRSEEHTSELQSWLHLV